MYRHIRLTIFRDVLLAIVSAAAILWLAPVGSAPTPDPAVAPPRINGAYDLEGAGPGVVVGRAVVSAQQVRVTGTYTDASGSAVPFSANLSMDRSTYRFKGTGAVGTSLAEVCGRVDPDDKSIKKCRVSGTFFAADGTTGRFMGPHR